MFQYQNLVQCYHLEYFEQYVKLYFALTLQLLMLEIYLPPKIIRDTCSTEMFIKSNHNTTIPFGKKHVDVPHLNEVSNKMMLYQLFHLLH